MREGSALLGHSDVPSLAEDLTSSFLVFLAQFGALTQPGEVEPWLPAPTSQEHSYCHSNGGITASHSWMGSARDV